MENTQHAITWFELPSVDFKRAVGFYDAILDTHLKVERFGADATDMAIFPASVDGTAGCVIHDPRYRPHADGVVVYLNCAPSIDRVLDRVGQASGTILTNKTALPPGMGFFAHIGDTEGNRVGLHALG
jgi:predicted enzyme related to lactoylglutathione lyase